jgi:hypothetical protein
MTRTRRELRRDIRRAERDVKKASVEDDGPRFVVLRRILDALREELAGLDEPRSVPEPALPPGTGTFTMRKTPRAVDDDDAARWRRLIAMRQGTPMSRTVYDPEATAARAARIEQRKENVTGLLPRSAMRAGAPVSRETRRR